MQSDQRKSCQVVVKHDIDMPALIIVATITGLALLPKMRVLDLMAPIARSIEFVVNVAAFVAGLTGNFGVAKMQGEVGCLVVIENRLTPSFGGMAGFAFATAATLMFIFSAMTGRACHVELHLFRFLGMAGMALDLRVPACQRKIRFPAVVKIGNVPATRRMTGSAIAAALTLMHIINLMTGSTLLRRCFEFLIHVTGVTCSLGMFASQGKLRFLVVK